MIKQDKNQVRTNREVAEVTVMEVSMTALIQKKSSICFLEEGYLKMEEQDNKEIDIKILNIREEVSSNIDNNKEMKTQFKYCLDNLLLFSL